MQARPRSRRRGVSMVLVSMLLVVLLLVSACAIDIGYQALAKAQLQNAADAAATAAPSQLFDRNELKGAPNQAAPISAARTMAQSFSASNSVAGAALLLDANTGNAAGGDVIAGYLAQPTIHSTSSDLAFNTSAPTRLSPPLLWLPTATSGLTVPFVTPPASAGSSYNSYNAIQIIAHRDSTRNGPVNLFLGGQTGMTSKSFTATATAAYEDNIVGFSIASASDPYRPGPSKLLPFAMDVNTYGAIAAGYSSVDLFKYNPSIAPVNGNYSARVSIADPSITGLLTGAQTILDPRYYSFTPYNLFTTPIGSPVGTPLDPSLHEFLPGDGIGEAVLVPLLLPQVMQPTVLITYVKTLSLLNQLGVLQLLYPTLSITLGTVTSIVNGQLLTDLTAGNILTLNTGVGVGNFGRIYLGTSSQASVTEFEQQVTNGVSFADFSQMGGSFQLGSNGTVSVQGDGVVTDLLLSTLQSIKGQPRVIALYKTVSSSTGVFPLNGTLTYQIVGFGGIIFVDVELVDYSAVTKVVFPFANGTVQTMPNLYSGSLPGIPAGNKSLKLIAQPEFVVDGTALGGGWTISQSTGARTSRFVYRPLVLTK